MRVKIFICSFCLALLCGCGTDNTATGFSHSPTIEVEEDVIASAEPTAVPEETSEVAETASIHGDVEIIDAAAIEGDVIEISENVFITQINDIYMNIEDYEDNIIVVEGMYALFGSYTQADTYPGVYRLGPGCCGNDGWGGFMLKYDGELPEENDWIKVTGTPILETTDDGLVNLFLDVISLEIMQERGAEFVLQ